MALQTALEKLQIRDEKNILIQGLPSSIEKPFAKLNYAKSVTPLLSSRKIDLALIFAVNIKQLSDIIAEVVPALHTGAKLWVAYPRPTSKIYSELSRDYDWEVLLRHGFEEDVQVELDNVWNAIWFKRSEKTLPARKKKMVHSRELETA
jgi:hypothetical protein